MTNDKFSELLPNVSGYIKEFDSFNDIDIVPKIITSANWNEPDNTGRIARAKKFLLQNLKQFWTPEEFALARDIKSWNALTDDEKRTYIRVLGGLTMLDTLQGDIGMPAIVDGVDSHYDKAVLSFMGAMENSIHARSYSNIFSTLATEQENEEVFEWLKEDKFIQAKANIIQGYYESASIDDKYSVLLAMFASGMLESFLFYSGFYYPLYLRGKGQVTASGETIFMIMRDESIHGVFVGELFMDRYNELNSEEQAYIKDKCFNLMFDLFDNEVEYTRYLYDDIGKTDDVMEFVKYNANKALMNFGFDTYYEHEDINPIVKRALNDTKHDFFSAKGQVYISAVVEALEQSDFTFEDIVLQENNAPDELIPIG